MLHSLFSRRGAMAISAVVLGAASMTSATAASAATHHKAPAPTFTGVTGPNGDGSLYTSGGQTATLATTNYAIPTGDTAQVTFTEGAVSTVAPILSSSPTAVTVTAPAEISAGPVAVSLQFLKAGKVKTTVGTNNATYEVQAVTPVTPAPVITGVTPNSGSTAGGTAVTITGVNLGSATGLSFGSTAATIGTDTATSITTTSPAGAAGTVDVKVTTAGGTSPTGAASDQFTYTTPVGPSAPVVTGISPTFGPAAGGTSVTITGTGFTGATAVNFGAVAATSVTVNSDTSVTAVTPAEASAAVQVQVVTPAGTSALVPAADTFTFRGTAYLPPATLIIGSGSATTYSVMQGLGDLFQDAPGCDLTNGTVNQLALQCSTATGSSGVSAAAGTAGGEAGLPVSDINPLNDYVANAPATGSGNGRNQLKAATPPLTGGPDGIAAFNISFARSSSYGGTDPKLNYVGWGTDGVSWVALNQVAGVATGHQAVTTISTANLQNIWKNTLSCTIGGATVTMDWRCLEAAQGVTVESSADPIDCYTTQTASGTYSTWQGYIGFTKNVNPPCSANEGGATSDPNAAANHVNLTENSMGVVGNAADAANAIYFYSYGKFTTDCDQSRTTDNVPAPNLTIYSANCPGTPANTITQFGGINGIYATQHTIQGNGDNTGVTFPDPRVLYNVYSNSTTGALAANAATLNFIGSTGFLCRDTTHDIDPTTGASYRSEIESVITANGFFPLDISVAGVPQPFVQTSLANVPAGVGAGTIYSADTLATGTYNGQTGPLGFCLNKN